MMTRRCLTLLALGLIILPAARAESSEDYGITITIGSITMTTAGAYGLAMALTNGVIAARGHRPHLALRVLGLVGAAANLGLAGMFFPSANTTDAKASRASLGFAVGHVLLGALDLSTVIWGWTRPAAARPVTLRPLLLSAPGGRLSLGGLLAAGRW